jgi:hypothetical protein
VSLLSLKGKLLKAFTAVAFASTAMGFLPLVTPQAEAAYVVPPQGTIHVGYSKAARESREALDYVIVNPVAANIKNLQVQMPRMEDSLVPFMAETAAEMNIPPDTRPDQITPEQRAHFIKTVEEKRLVAQMSSDTREQAEAHGLRDWLSPFFEKTKVELGYSGAVTLGQAQEIDQKLFDQHYDKNIQPKMEVTAATLVMAATVYAMKKNTRG